MTRISISGIHNYFNYPFLKFSTTLLLFASYSGCVLNKIYAVFLHNICNSYLGHTLLLLTEFTVKQLRLFAKIVIIPSGSFNSVMHCFYIHITNTVIVFLGCNTITNLQEEIYFWSSCTVLQLKLQGIERK